MPGSDGAGVVVAVGCKVTRFQKGSKVVTQFNQKHIYGSLNSNTIHTALGGDLDGVLRQYGTFNEEGLVPMPETLSYIEASTLTGAGLTAWNALYGLKPVKPGDFVLTQGMGGVSVFAIQFAKAAGAKVIATTSSPTKVQKLKDMGVDHVINYRDVANWGEEAKKLTGSREGVDYVIEIGGGGTMAQSIKSIRIDGIISVIGWLTKSEEKEPSFLETVSNVFTVRGLFVGSRAMFEDMVSSTPFLFDPRLGSYSSEIICLRFQRMLPSMPTISSPLSILRFSSWRILKSTLKALHSYC